MAHQRHQPPALLSVLACHCVRLSSRLPQTNHHHCHQDFIIVTHKTDDSLLKKTSYSFSSSARYIYRSTDAFWCRLMLKGIKGTSSRLRRQIKAGVRKWKNDQTRPVKSFLSDDQKRFVFCISNHICICVFVFVSDNAC